MTTYHIRVVKAYKVVRQADITIEATDEDRAHEHALQTPDRDGRWSTTWRLTDDSTESVPEWIQDGPE